MNSSITLKVGEFTLTADDRDDEPRIKDEELGRLLGYERPRKVRELIRRNEAHLGTVRPTVGQTSAKGGRPSIEYHLTEAQALFIAARSETVVGAEVLSRLIAVYLDAGKQLRAQHSPVPVHAELVNGPRMGDSVELRSEISAACRLAAAGSGYSLRKIQGYVRKIHRISSPYYLALIFWPSVREMLVRIGLREVSLPGTSKAQLALVRHIDRRQATLPGVS